MSHYWNFQPKKNIFQKSNCAHYVMLICLHKPPKATVSGDEHTALSIFSPFKPRYL